MSCGVLQHLHTAEGVKFIRGPVWVYVLERRRAAEVWNALMGEEDPERARVNSANSLRAIYGVDLAQNAVMGSPSTDVAEEQISCLFQSSPPFLPQEPDELDEMDSMAQRLSLDTQGESYPDQDHMLSPTSSQLSARLTSSGSRNETSLTSNSSSERKAVTSSNGKVPFKARPVPKTHLTPDITPRTTKSAALRAGLPVTPAGLKGPRVIPTKEETKQAFLDVPGHKRSSTIQVASTAAPTIAPRMSRAAELRLTKRTMSTPTGNFAPPTKPKARPSVSNGNIFEGIPGHKRRESISVASVQAPIVSPRLNKSSALRAKRDSAPPTSFMCMSHSLSTLLKSFTKPCFQSTLLLNPSYQVDFLAAQHHLRSLLCAHLLRCLAQSAHRVPGPL